MPVGKIKNLLLRVSGIKLSMDCFIGRQTLFVDAFIPNLIEIGSKVSIAPGCRLIAASDPFPSLLREKKLFIKKEKIVIKKNAWIGSGVVILPGVVIGESSVIGAGSIVTKSTGDFEIWFGNPATLQGRIND